LNIYMPVRRIYITDRKTSTFLSATLALSLSATKAVNLLARQLAGAPGVADTLAAVASRDPSADLRNVANGVLTKPR
jgi:hypothetical protein